MPKSTNNDQQTTRATKRVLVTGGAGYIGSHTCLELLSAGHEVVVVDNLSNSSSESLRRVRELTGRTLKFFETDLRDEDALDEVFAGTNVDAVIHFAGLKAVGESVTLPLKYYDNNITGTIVLCRVMGKYNVKNIVFSSSATVYGDPQSVPIKENARLDVTNPYGRTKLMIEEIFKDLVAAGELGNVVLLRYFNPVGAHPSGKIGEDPNGIPNNLCPYICQVASGKLAQLSVFGNDYETPDGTGVRDYIHVVDLALAHKAALGGVGSQSGLSVYNVGTGRGYSVLEMVAAFRKVSGKPIPYKVVGRRSGDIATCFADPSKIRDELGWVAMRGLEQMVSDAWHWQANNPDGYRTG